MEVAFQYNDQYNENVFSYVNNINTIEGGTHLVGFRTALTRSLNSYASKNNLVKENGVQLTGDDFREGLTAVLSAKVPEPQFEGQTKTKLGNSEIKGVCRNDCQSSNCRFGWMKIRATHAVLSINVCALPKRVNRAESA